MRDLYGDEYDSVAGDGDDRLIPQSLQRLASALVFVGLVALMGLWAYRLGTRDAAEVPVIRAMQGPARVAPDDPGGLQTAHKGLEVNAVLGGAPEPAARAVAAPAEPAAPVLTQEDAPRSQLMRAGPADLVKQVLGAEADLPAPAEAAGPDALAGSPFDTETTGTEPAPQFALAGIDDMADAPASGAGASIAGPRPMMRPASLPGARTSTTNARPGSEPAPAAQVNEVANLSAGTRLVQLGAYDSEEIARQAWQRLVASNGDLLGDKSLYVERTTTNARVFYRLRVAGFSDTDGTRAMCEALRARSIDCIPVTLQ